MSVDLARVFMVSRTSRFRRSGRREIQFDTYAFEINGQTYTIPKADQTPKVLILPIDYGIVWAPISKSSLAAGTIKQSLQGYTDIYYTPYAAGGGSLLKDRRLIARLPHRWMGLDAAVVDTAWTGWLPSSDIAFPTVKAVTTYHTQYAKNGALLSATPVKGAVPGWPTLFIHRITKSAYYDKPHYYAGINRLTRTHDGFVLNIALRDATNSGRNAGLTSAAYYWSARTMKWTPLSQNYTVQTLSAGTLTGSDAVYWIQPLSIGDGSGSELDTTEMYFNPASLTIRSVWLGDWFYGPSFVDGKSWVAMISENNQSNRSLNGWTVYTPPNAG
jgi:hypothetical protein